MMLLARRRRLYLIITIVIGVGIAVTLALLALGQNIDLYYTPAQLLTHRVKTPKGEFRLGGFVKLHSVHHATHSLNVTFTLTDHHHQITVKYHGLLPSLFRTGQGIVAQGRLKNGVFIADQVLAKHDATYRPPNLALQNHLKKQHQMLSHTHTLLHHAQSPH